MAVNRDNPAGRLYLILKRMTLAASGGTTPILAGIFELEKEDAAGIVERLLLLLKITDEAESAAQSVQGVSKELITRPFPQIRNALKKMLVSLPKGWDDIHRTLNRIDYTALELCSELLSQFGNEKALEEGTIEKLLGNVDQLTTQVVESLLSDELKTILIDHLQAIRRAVINYPITGSAGIRETTEAAAGTVIINYNLFAAAQDSKDSGIVDKYVKLLDVLNKTISVGQVLLPIAPLLLRAGL
jgi:hypothetical protein